MKPLGTFYNTISLSIQGCNVTKIIPLRQLDCFIWRQVGSQWNSTRQAKWTQITNQTHQWTEEYTYIYIPLNYLQDFQAGVLSTTGLQGCHCNIWQACTVVLCSSGSQMTVWLGSLMSQRLCHEEHRSHPANIEYCYYKTFWPRRVVIQLVDWLGCAHHIFLDGKII